MGNLRDIRRRIKSVKNTSQITRAMQMVASAKMRRAQDQAVKGRPYIRARAHVVEARPGLEVKPGDRVHLSIDAERRRRIEAHHTATHLLHCALHQVVSPDAAQQGSFVSEDRLRFDFNSSAVSPDQLRLIEEKVNGWVEESLPVHCTERAYADVEEISAVKVNDLTAIVETKVAESYCWR